MSRARSLSRLATADTFTVDANNKVGIGSTTPDAKLDVVGIVSATAFYGDGSNLEGVASAGLGTALGENDPLAVVYYTDNVLNITDTTTITVPTGSDTAYTQYAEIVVADTKDLIVTDGDDFVPDILGLSTEGITPLGGSGGRIRADLFTNHAGTGAPTFQTGVVVTGVATATSFSGNLTGNVTGNASGTAGGLTGSPNITVGSVTGTTGSFSGSVSIGGTLTYEDVTNIDSVGVVTARQGIVVTSGISTFKGAHFDGGLLKEKANIVANRLSDVTGVHVDLENGMTHVYTTDEDAGGASLAVNLRVSGSVELMDRLALGETISINIITKPNGAGYIDEYTVDGQAVTEEWSGGAAPSGAAAGGYDLNTIQITRIANTGTENTDLLVQCNNSNFA